MTIIDILDNQNFSELVNFDFEEVRAVFNLYGYYVSAAKSREAFLTEAKQAKAEYSERLQEIDRYKKGEYCKIAESRCPDFDEEPAYMEHCLRAETRDRLKDLIEKYFDEATYKEYRATLVKGIATEQRTENPAGLKLELTVEKGFIHAFLSTIGYWQRHAGYFLSNRAFWEICTKYTSEVLKMNPEFQSEDKKCFFNIFLGAYRLDSDKYIDIDTISYIKLIEPYLQTNTEQLTEIVNIIASSFRQRGESERWGLAMDRIDDYIEKCTREGVMIVL